MGMRRRTRRRALVAGVAVAHHADKKRAAAEQAPADGYQDQATSSAPPADQAGYAPPPADPASEIEHLAQLHASGALTDEEFAAAKAKAPGS